MELEDSIEKSAQKDLNQAEDVPFNHKIYNFFYQVLEKKGMNQYIYVLLFILEAIQLNSFIFNSKHQASWSLSEKTINLLDTIFGSTRVSALMKYVQFKNYIIAWAIVLVYTFGHWILILMVIQFNKVNSKFYGIVAQTSRIFSDILTTVLLIPFAELLIIMFNCHNGKIGLVLEGITCYSGIHILYFVLSLIFLIVFLLLVIFHTAFSFDPFNHTRKTVRLDITSDILLYIIKIVSSIQILIIKNEWVCIVIMLLLAIFNLKVSIDCQSYVISIQQYFILIRNATFFWAYLILIISKIINDPEFIGQIYLLVFGYPLVVVVCIFYYKKINSDQYVANFHSRTPSEFIGKAKIVMKLIENYLDIKTIKVSKNNQDKKCEILLRGYIMNHLETCLVEDCPLIKFIENTDNFSLQKTCLLQHMNFVFLDGIKDFPQSRMIVMLYISFNFEKKYNLSVAKNFFTKLEKGKNTLLESYIIFCIQKRHNIYNNKPNKKLKNEDDEMEPEDQTQEQFYRLKFFIETSTKLYGEFWGILSTNLTVNLNLHKLFNVGNRLNNYLKETNKLWENELKSKRIDLENQSIIQLYAHFLRKILRNRKKADEITKKLNEEQLFESKKNEEENWEVDNLTTILEKQEYIIYSRSNEKGECQVFQCSNSVVHLLGYPKQEFIGKTIETIMPSLFSQSHSAMLSKRIKMIRGKLSESREGKNSDNKKQYFVLPKTKIGYMLALNAKFTVYNDDDFSHTYIIKAKFDNIDSKFNYGCYILTNDEFVIDSISSSAINLGLSLDLLKKYVMSLNILIRDENNLNEIDFTQCYQEYEIEPKKVTWIFPYIIYPKNDTLRQKDEGIAQLIEKSESKVFNLQITKLKYSEQEVIGYCFRLSDVNNGFNIKKSKLASHDFMSKCHHKIIFDLLRLSYTRTELVNKKDNDEDYFELGELQSNTSPKNFRSPRTIRSKKSFKNPNTIKSPKSSKNRKETLFGEESNYEDDNEDIQANELSADKIIEYQGKNTHEVKQFILTLPFYGSDIMIEKHRPNREKYAIGKSPEPEIKINIAEFLKRIEAKLYLFKNNKMKDAKKSYNSMESLKSTSTNSTSQSQEQSNYLQGKLSADSSSYLSSIFNEKSVSYINILSLCSFFLLLALISLEFALSLLFMKEINDRLGYIDKAYDVLSGIMYTKFFVTEAVQAQDKDYPHTEGLDTIVYIKGMMQEMSIYRKVIFDNYSSFQNASVSFSKEFSTYIATTNATIHTIVNMEPVKETLAFASMMSRIPTNIFYVSTVTDNYNTINMENRNAYELMKNSLNEYFILWKTATDLLVIDTKENCVSSLAFLLIYCLSFLISILSLITLWFLVIKFIDDRERPVNLFLTIKKQRFEDLKTSSETFLNKLLNKFFGNEEAEDESIIETSSTHLKADDIMITKFNQKTEYKQSVRNFSEYLFNYIKIVIFFSIIEAYMSFKYFYRIDVMKGIGIYSDILNVTHYSQSDMVLNINIYKSFFFDKTIPIFNEDNTDEVFIVRFSILTAALEKLIFGTFKAKNFLQRSYLETFFLHLNSDMTDVIPQKDTIYKQSLLFGFKPIAFQFIEHIRFLNVLYLETNKSTDVYSNDVVGQMNYIIRYIVRPWYLSLLNLLHESFQNYYDEIYLIEITLFITLIIAIILLYCFVWKIYVDKLKVLLKTSVDLINLIPEEIKDSIVQRLQNEQEDKKES